MADGIDLDAILRDFATRKIVEAAYALEAEVERLRAENRELQEEAADYEYEITNCDVLAVRAERDDLRARIGTVKAATVPPSLNLTFDQMVGYETALVYIGEVLCAPLADPDDAELIRTAEQRMANDDGRRYTLDEVTAALAAPTEDSDQ